jgi:hypothetical protein
MRFTRTAVNKMTMADQLGLVQNDGLIIQLVDNQTEGLCRAAVRQNGNAIRWIKKVNLRILLEVVLKWENTSRSFIDGCKLDNNDSSLPDFFDSAYAKSKPVCINDQIKGNHYRKNVSVYSGLSGSELRSLHDTLAEKYARLCRDKTIGIKERLERIASSIETEKPGKKKIALKDFIREWLYRQFRETSLLVWLSMVKRRDFGSMREEDVYSSFIRNIMDIPNNRHLSITDIFYFDMILKHYDDVNGNKSGDEYFELANEISIELFGEMFCSKEIDEIVCFLETDGFRNVTGDPCGIKFLFGKKEEKIVNGKKFIIYSEEYARTPQHTLCNVAWANSESITLRRESLSVIFYTKWETCYQTAKYRKGSIEKELNAAICEGIKQKALEFYRAYNTNGIARIKPLFLKEMEEGICAHEADGHQAADALLDLTRKIIRNTFCDDDDNVVYTLREAEADWTGTIPWFLSVAKEKGPEAGARVIWVYLSDNFFIDNDNNYYALMTKTLIGLVLPFIRSDGSVDFAALSERQDIIRNKLQVMMERVIARLLALLESTEYQILNFKFNYQRLEEELFNILKQDKPDYSRQELEKNWTYWDAIVRMLKYFSAHGKEDAEKILAEESACLEAFVLKMAGAESGISLMEYLYACFERIGIFRRKRKKIFVGPGIK